MDAALQRDGTTTTTTRAGDITLRIEKFPLLCSKFDKLEHPARFLIDASHMKMFCKAIDTMVSLGDSLMFFPSSEGLMVKACNLQRSVAAQVHFRIDFFGAIHTFDPPAAKPCCRILTRAFIGIIKNVEMKNMQHFMIDMDTNAEKMLVRIRYQDGMGKIYKMSVTDILANTIPKVFPRDVATNSVMVEARHLLSSMDIFADEIKELAVYASPTEALIHNVYSALAVNIRWRKTAVRLMDVIAIHVEHAHNFTFPVQAVRHLCKFADTQYGAVEFNFATKNYPLFAIHDVQGLCEVMFIMVTSDAGGREATEKIAQMLPDIVVTSAGGNSTTPVRPFALADTHGFVSQSHDSGALAAVAPVAATAAATVATAVVAPAAAAVQVASVQQPTNQLPPAGQQPPTGQQAPADQQPPANQQPSSTTPPPPLQPVSPAPDAETSAGDISTTLAQPLDFANSLGFTLHPQPQDNETVKQTDAPPTDEPPTATSPLATLPPPLQPALSAPAQLTDPTDTHDFVSQSRDSNALAAVAAPVAPVVAAPPTPSPPPPPPQPMSPILDHDYINQRPWSFWVAAASIGLIDDVH